LAEAFQQSGAAQDRPSISHEGVAILRHDVLKAVNSRQNVERGARWIFVDQRL
jgi:hypothetical protein